MSAETIPSDVPAVGSVWVKKPNPVTVAASISTGVSYNFDGGSGEATLSRFLQEYEPADRSTRPAEPAAPVAEAVDGDVVAWRWRVYGCWTGMSRVEPPTLGPDASDLEALVRLSTFQAERARADAAEQRAADALARVRELEFGAGFEAAFDAVVRPGSRYENWTPADDPAEIVTDLYNDLEDALARAEKAEGALETAREDTARLDYLDRCNQALNAHYGTTYRWELVQSHNVNRLMLGHMVVDLNDSAAKGLPSCRDAIDRARREAQPATDGGDNG